MILTSSNLAGLFLILHLQSDLFLLLQIDSINSQQRNYTAAIEYQLIIIMIIAARKERRVTTEAIWIQLRRRTSATYKLLLINLFKLNLLTIHGNLHATYCKLNAVLREQSNQYIAMVTY